MKLTEEQSESLLLKEVGVFLLRFWIKYVTKINALANENHIFRMR